ncbi:MAG: hypothetical protein RL685_629 [Pseudomonadota bacterium]|jgi:hypothetical protein
MLEKSTALLSLALLASACTAEDPTEIVGGVTTQIKVPEYLRSVGVVVQVEGEVKFCEVYPVTDGRTVLPATLGVLGAAGLTPSDTVTVQILGLRSEAPQYEPDCVFARPEPAMTTNREVMVIRRRRLTFVDGRILYLPLPLKESCSDVACNPDQTCIGGRCVTMDIDSSTLPDYREPLAFGDTNTCFNGDICLPQVGTLPPLLTDPSTCTFQVPWRSDFPRPDTGDLNVRMYYASLGTEVLDIDPASAPEDQRDGFSFPDPNDPLTFRLSRNLCETQYQTDKILAVEASAFCAAKRPFQPLCNDYVAPNPRDPMAGLANQGAGYCTIASLQPVESVLYVLMDNSFPMYPFYGVGGLRFAIDLPLASPVARQAHVAFGSLPAAPEQCGTNAYATPQVPFDTVTNVREPIGNILGTPLDQVAMINPPTVNLEAALQGAYSAIASTPITAADGAAQRALVLISNRDLSVGACMGGPTALERVQAAASGPSRIATYAVALGDPNQNATADAATVATATGLAAAGRTRVFNAVADVAEGATAVLDVLTDLGTCLYRVNRDDLGVPGTIPDSSVISYIDPANPSSSAVDIPFNPGCAAGSAAEVSGWNRELVNGTSLVRVCGNACTGLRDVISNISSVHLAAQQQASTTEQQYSIPPVPVVVSAPCGEFISLTVNQ